MNLLNAFLATRAELEPETAFAEWALFCARHGIEPGSLASFHACMHQVTAARLKQHLGSQRPFWRKVEGRSHGTV